MPIGYFTVLKWSPDQNKIHTYLKNGLDLQSDPFITDKHTDTPSAIQTIRSDKTASLNNPEYFIHRAMNEGVPTHMRPPSRPPPPSESIPIL